MIDIRLGKDGQVFSLDVLFALLPILMILGASLQYLYLAEEQATSIVVTSSLEKVVQGMSEQVKVSLQADSHPKQDNCVEFADILNNYAGDYLPGDHLYFTDVWSYGDDSYLCTDADEATYRTWSSPTFLDEHGRFSLDYFNNTAASEVRFVLQHDASDAPEPGKIAGVSFTIWEDTP